MENLTQWIVYGVLLAVMYFIVGYHIAQQSRMVRKNWDKLGWDRFAIPLKIFLYPMNASEALESKKPFWFLTENGYNATSYVVKHLFLWPIRIAGNIFLLVAIFVLIPMFVFLVSLILQMAVGTVKAVAGKIKGEASS